MFAYVNENFQAICPPFMVTIHFFLTLMRRKSLFVRYAESTLHLFGLSIYLHSTCAYSMCIPLVASAATTKPHSTLFVRLTRSILPCLFVYRTIHMMGIYMCVMHHSWELISCRLIHTSRVTEYT